MITVSWRQGQQSPIDLNKDFISMLTEQIAYEEINGMFSRDLADIYQRLGLNGFKRMKRYQGVKEIQESAHMRNFIVDYMDVIPEFNINYTSPTGISTLKDALNLDHTMCIENESRLSALIEKSITEKRFCVMDMLTCMLNNDVSRRFKIERVFEECEYVTWDKVYIMQFSQKLHEKYKKKEKESKMWTSDKKY